MNATETSIAAEAHVDAAAIAPLPNSKKIYVEGSRADLRVPLRYFAKSDTPASFGAEPNPPIFVYDCSGPYSDPAAKIDIRSGLPALRQGWIEERGDTEVLAELSSEYGRARAADPKLDELRFPGLHRKPRRAKAGANLSGNLSGNVTQMHYARRGIITPRWSSSRSARTSTASATSPRCAPAASRARRWPTCCCASTRARASAPACRR